jgi:hypothetical protein
LLRGTIEGNVIVYVGYGAAQYEQQVVELFDRVAGDYQI